MSAVMTSSALPTPWRQALPATVLVIAAVLWMFRDSFAGMAEIWSRSDTFAHGWLVPPIALWLAWRARPRLAVLSPRPQPWLLLPIVAAGGAWLLGALASINAVTQLAATTMLVLAVPATLGWAVARVLAFPLLFLFFMVPIGEFLLPVLMEGTADFTVTALQITGVPVYREGLQFIIPTGSWSVVEACSGVRYLIASFMVGTLFAYLNYRSTRRRLVFVAVSIAVPIVANWVRAYLIVMLGHLSNNRIATGVDHLVYGWVFFGVVIGLMFFIGARWSEPDAPPPPPPAPGAVAAASPGLQWGAAALLVAVLAWPGVALDRIEHQVAAGTPAFELPADLPGWQRQAVPEGSFAPVHVGAALERGALYRAGDQDVVVHVAYYRGQGPGRKLTSSENVLVRSNDHGRNLVGLHGSTVAVGGQAVGFRQADVMSGHITRVTEDNRLEVRQLYWVAGRWAATPEEAALQGVLARLAGGGDDAASVVLHTRGAKAAQTSSTLDEFMQKNLGRIEAALAAARAGR